MNFENDIPESLARAAHSGTSFVPEKRGQAERADYAATLTADYNALRQQAERGGTLALFDEEFARYREGYARHTRAYLASKSRCMSPMITGPSRFPVARNEKRGAISHKRLIELLDFRERAKRAILAKLRPDLRPIMAGDADALIRLQRELSELRAAHQQMKDANAAIREHSTVEAQCMALIGLGFTQKQATELLNPPHPFPRGYASFSLRNSSANIRRVETRIASVAAAQAKPVTQIQGTNARLEDDPPANRIRLYFPDKPERTIREKLKAKSFRWAPSIGAWQAYRNTWSLQLAHEIAGTP